MSPTGLMFIVALFSVLVTAFGGLWLLIKGYRPGWQIIASVVSGYASVAVMVCTWLASPTSDAWLLDCQVALMLTAAVMFVWARRLGQWPPRWSSLSTGRAANPDLAPTPSSVTAAARMQLTRRRILVCSGAIGGAITGALFGWWFLPVEAHAHPALAVQLALVVAMTAVDSAILWFVARKLFS